MSPVVVARPARVFYGWWVALAFVAIVFLTTGVRFTVGPFLKPIVSDLGLDRGSLSLVTLDLSGALDNEAAGQAKAITTEDHAEGVRAFLEKRPPRFTDA